MRINSVAKVKEVLYQEMKGVSQRRIAESLGISRNTIRNYCNLAADFGFNSVCSNDEIDRIAVKVHEAVYHNARNRPKQAMDAITPFHEQIKQYLSEKWITNKQIHRLLKEKGLKSSPRTIGRYIQYHFPKEVKSTVHLETIAGAEAQVDYGSVGTLNNRKIYAFVMTLSHSRYRYVEFVYSQNAQSWAQSHINAFKFFGAVPDCVLLDNLKSGVINADIYDPVINPTYADLSRHFGFIADPAKARTPEHKGKVERSVRIVKEQVIAGRQFNNLEDLNDFALNWCRNTISHEVCSTTGRKPIDVFNKEDLPAMQPLPSNEFDMPVWSEAKVHLDHHFRVSGNFYSLPTEYIGQTVKVRIGFKTIRAYVNHCLITTHLKATGKGKWVTNKNHYPEHVAHYLAQGVEDCLASAEAIGSATLEFIKVAVKTKSKTAIRKAQGVLRLAETYSPERVEDACMRAIMFDNYEYKCLSKILKDNLDDKTTKGFSPTRMAENAYIRSPYEYTSSMEVHYG